MNLNRTALSILCLSLPVCALAGATSTGATTVTSSAAEQDKAALLKVMDEQRRAMIAGDIEALGAVLDDHFTAVHITGYRQPRAEWLAQIKAGQFDDHRVQDQGTTVTIHPGTPGTATVVGRSLVDVTIGGSRGTWRLETTTQLTKRGGTWKIMSSRSTTS